MIGLTMVVSPCQCKGMSDTPDNRVLSVYQLVLESKKDGASVLRRVTDDWEQDDADEAH